MERIELWECELPLYNGQRRPEFYYYPTENKRGRGTVIICPGGAYGGHASHEGEGYAKFLNEIGLNVFVLIYRVFPYGFPAALLDARRAIRYVRANAEKFGIDADKVAIMGSSSGGHLSALTSTYRDPIDGEGVDEIDLIDPTPSAQILCYPVTDYASHKMSYIRLLGEDHTEEERLKITPNELVSEHTPPAFIWHTFEDEGVAISSMYDYAIRLKNHNGPTEIHVYPYGRHGLGLGNVPERGIVPHVQSWAELLKRWLTLYKFIEG